LLVDIFYNSLKISEIVKEEEGIVRKISTFFWIVFASILFTFSFQPSTSYALCPLGQYHYQGGGCADADLTTGNNATLSSEVTKAVKAAAGITLGIGVLLIVYSGYQYTKSAGDVKKVETAKMFLLAAFISIFLSLGVFVWYNFFAGILF
jgi:hypothetical protein